MINECGASRIQDKEEGQLKTGNIGIGYVFMTTLHSVVFFRVRGREAEGSKGCGLDECAGFMQCSVTRLSEVVIPRAFA